MRIRDANVLRKKLSNHLEWLRKNGKMGGALSQCVEVLINAIDDIPEIVVVPMAEHEALLKGYRALEKRLSDVGASPFDGGMSQKEYFGYQPRDVIRPSNPPIGGGGEDA